MLKVLGLFCVALTLSACTSYASRVDAFVSPAFQPTLTHVVVPADSTQKGDLQFQEVAAQVTRTLVGAGLPLAAPGQTPDVAVFVQYGIGEPRTVTRVSSSPVHGYVQGTTAQTTGTVKVGASTAQVNATTRTSPIYQVVGTETKTSTTTYYDRFLTLQGADIAKWTDTQEIDNLWQVQVRSTGSSGDLRAVIPYMLRAAQPYIGHSTGKQVEVSYTEDDPEVEAIRTGAVPGN